MKRVPPLKGNFKAKRGPRRPQHRRGFGRNTANGIPATKSWMNVIDLGDVYELGAPKTSPFKMG